MSCSREEDQEKRDQDSSSSIDDLHPRRESIEHERRVGAKKLRPRRGEGQSHHPGEVDLNVPRLRQEGVAQKEECSGRRGNESKKLKEKTGKRVGWGSYGRGRKISVFYYRGGASCDKREGRGDAPCTEEKGERAQRRIGKGLGQI